MKITFRMDDYDGWRLINDFDGLLNTGDNEKGVMVDASIDTVVTYRENE